MNNRSLLRYIVFGIIFMSGIIFISFNRHERLFHAETKKTQAQPLSAATATIDESSLHSTSSNPTISGIASGVSSVAILIYPNAPDQQFAYGAFGAFQGTANVYVGHWSFTVKGPSNTSGLAGLPPGSYLIDVREFTGLVPKGGQGFANLLTGRDLTTGELIISQTHQSP